MLIALVFFSTEESRRRWLFNLNALALVFGILQGILLSALYAHNILSPLSTNLVHFDLAVNILFLFAPLFVESILIFRLVAVFPSRVNGLRTVLLVVSFPIIVRIGRVINMSIAIAKAVQAASQGIADQWFAVLPYARAEWILALVDTSYVSIVFLYRLKGRRPKTTRGSIFRGSEMTSRLHGLFYIAISNFVLPCVLGFVQVILVFTVPVQGSSEEQRITWFFECSYIMITYNYLTIIGVVFATVWSTGSTWALERHNASSSFQPEKMFVSATSSGATAVSHSRNRSIPTVHSKLLVPADQFEANDSPTPPKREFSPLRYQENFEPERPLVIVPDS
jgi:hypothetical protein